MAFLCPRNSISNVVASANHDDRYLHFCETIVEGQRLLNLEHHGKCLMCTSFVKLGFSFLSLSLCLCLCVCLCVLFVVCCCGAPGARGCGGGGGRGRGGGERRSQSFPQDYVKDGEPLLE